MKKIFRITARIIGKLTYLTSAILIAAVLTAGLFGGLGYYYYDGYYQDYMKVQQEWAVVDDLHVSYINKVEDHLPDLKKALSSKKFESDEAKADANSKLRFLETNLINAVNSMSYQEKFASYPAFVNTTNDVLFLLGAEEGEELKSLYGDLNGFEKEIIAKKKSYNAEAKTFNERSEKFPESVIADVGSFHTWNAMP